MRYRTGLNIIHRVEEIINEDPGKSMQSIARKLNMSGSKIRKVVAENINRDPIMLNGVTIWRS